MSNMSNYPTLKAEFAEIIKTRFWAEYSENMANQREQIVSQLLNIGTDLGKPMCLGTVLQKVLWYLDRLWEIPAKIIAEE